MSSLWRPLSRRPYRYGLEVGGIRVFWATGVFATAASDSTVSPFQAWFRVVGLSRQIAQSETLNRGVFCTVVRGRAPSSSAPGRNRSRGPPDLRVLVRDRDHSRLDSRGLAASDRVATAFSAKLLSWGFPKIASPPASTPHVRPRVSAGPDGCPSFGAKMPLFARAPFLPFLPASTVSSVRPLAGLLRPAAGHEVRPVSDLW